LHASGAFVIVSGMAIAGVLPYIQIALAVLLMVCILLQQTGASLGGAFGGDNFTAGYHTRRGSEKYLFWASIILGILFAGTAFFALIIK
jgi:protein translocase SecG subunit